MLFEVVITIGAILFIASFPISFAIGMYNYYHPKAQKKMQEALERHKILSTVFLLIYVILSLTGIMGNMIILIFRT